MTHLTLLSAFNYSLKLIIIGVCFITLPTLITGIIVAIMQAATQINEMSLTFIPKLLVMFAVLFFTLPWLLNSLVGATEQMFYDLPNYIR